VIWTRSLLTLLTVLLLAGGAASLLAAQDLPAQNPYQDDADAIRTGMGLYRWNCADCHGVDASGVRGPDLTGVWASGRTDAGLFRTIQNGIAGTEMVPVRRAREDEIWKILAYLRTLSTSTLPLAPTGDVANGETIFSQNCSGCHRVNTDGGRVGPDLSRVGSSRSRATLVSRIREGIPPQSDSGFAPVTLTTQGGELVRGVTKNEDMFSIQIMEVEGRIQGFDKESLEALDKPVNSLMPVFPPDRLSEDDLNDLVSYLETLRGFDPAVIVEQ